MNHLKYWSVLLIFEILTAGCAERSEGARQPSVTVGFADGNTTAHAGAPVIDVRASNRLPLTSAELIDPDGRVLTAAQGRLDPQMSAGYPFGSSVGFGVFGGSGGSFGTGVGVSVPLGGYGSATVPAGEFVHSCALLLVPDLVTYRQAWPQSVVRLKFGTAPGDVTTADIPAPAPGGR